MEKGPFKDKSRSKNQGQIVMKPNSWIVIKGPIPGLGRGLPSPSFGEACPHYLLDNLKLRAEIKQANKNRQVDSGTDRFRYFNST